MTKKEFNELLEETKRHWEEDILGASARDLRYKPTPINMESCAVCIYFGENCHVCFLRENIAGCMDEVCEANGAISIYRHYITLRDIKPVRRACQKAYKAILKRFEEYRKENFGD